MSWRNTVCGLMLLMLFIGIVFAGESKWFSKEDCEKSEEILKRFNYCAESETQKALVREIEMRHRAFCLFRAETQDFDKALKKLEENKAASLMALQLKDITHSNLDRSSPVLESLGRIRDMKVIPAILEALKKVKSWPIEGSSGKMKGNLRFRKAAVESLEQLTGRKYKVTAYSDNVQIKKIIDDVEKYWESIESSK